MSINYPTSVDNGTSLPNPSATNDTNSPSLSSGQVLQNSAVIALETKLGINSSTASTHTVLLGTGTGASTWGTLTSSYVTSATGTGAFVFASAPTITSATLTTPVINNPTLNTDSVVGFTTSNNGSVYGVSVTGGKISASSYVTAGSVSYANLSSSIFSGQVTSYSNGGTAGGTFHYANIGGIKMLWGFTDTISTSITTASVGLTLPNSFFSTIQSISATATQMSTTATQYANVASINGPPPTSVTLYAFTTTSTGTTVISVFIIGT